MQHWIWRVKPVLLWSNRTFYWGFWDPKSSFFRSKRHWDFYDSFVRGEQSFTVGFGEASLRPAGDIHRVVKMPQECETQRHHFIREQQGWNPITAWERLSGPEGTSFTWTHPAKFSSMNTNMFISVLTLNDLFNCKELWENWEENIQ